MNKRIVKLSVIFLAGYFIIFPRQAKAVIPPDFIFNIGTQVAQFFSVIIILFSAIFGTFIQFFKTKFYAIKHKKIILALIIFLIIAISLASSYLYGSYRQKAEYKKWLEESKKYEIPQKDYLDSDNDGVTDSEELNNEIMNSDYLNEQALTGENAQGDENDQLIIGNGANNNIDTSSDKFVSKIDMADSSAKFIGDYYKNIALGDFKLAYEMSKKSVSFDIFKNWYIKTTKITLDKLVRIDEKKSSVELTLFEGNIFTRYGVLMTLSMRGKAPVKVEKSEVKILSQGLIEEKNVFTDKNIILEEYGFFEKNKDAQIFTANSGFKNITDSSKEDYVVLDAREDIEYENGYFPGSSHIRFADLKAGRWIELPKEKFVYVICWSGIRGKEVAEFLRTKKIAASYLEQGANGWVEFGGKWTGNIKFGEKYADLKYQIVFSTKEVKNKLTEGAVLVDTREPYKFKEWHIAGSVNIPIMYTPTIGMEDVFSRVKAGSKVITVCDGYVNCFDAKITGVELERRGNQFLGRYNKPWEYEK